MRAGPSPRHRPRRRGRRTAPPAPMIVLGRGTGLAPALAAQGGGVAVAILAGLLGERRGRQAAGGIGPLPARDGILRRQGGSGARDQQGEDERSERRGDITQGLRWRTGRSMMSIVAVIGRTRTIPSRKYAPSTSGLILRSETGVSRPHCPGRTMRIDASPLPRRPPVGGYRRCPRQRRNPVLKGPRPHPGRVFPTMLRRLYEWILALAARPSAPTRSARSPSRRARSSRSRRT